MKRFMKFMLTLVLAAMIIIPSVSALENHDDSKNSGTITINNAVLGKTYNVYRILRLDSCTGNADNSACASSTDGYVYMIDADSPWKTFVEGSEYLSVDAGGYVTWNGEQTAERVSAFAEAALTYAKNNADSVASTKYSVTAEKVDPNCEGDSCEVAAVIDNLPLGYYVVDSSLGAICGLTTTKPATSVNEKNSMPTVEKQVKENNGGYGSSNTAFIGETVEFKIEVNVGLGAEKYVLTDTMTDGLTLTPATIAVKYDGTTVDANNYTLTTSDHGFVITFNEDYVRTLVLDKKIVVTYKAVLNENAIVGKEDNDATTADQNLNTITLKYGDNHTITSSTKTYTYGFDIVKTDDQDNVLEGAKFRLYDALTGGNQICLVKVSDGRYRVNHNACTTNPDTFVEMDGTNTGVIRIEGLDAKTYYVEETLNPDGYTKLLTREDITITDDNNYTVVNNNKWESGGLKIENVKGNLLPETGGIGTVLFITLGSLMVVLFGGLLVVKARMSKDNK